MDLLIKRGLSHKMGVMPKEKPILLNEVQEDYYNKMTGEEFHNKNYEKIINEEKEIENENELWIAVIYCKNKLIDKYIFNDKEKTKLALKYVISNDAFSFMNIRDSLSIMKLRYESERGYFEIVKGYYKILIQKAINEFSISKPTEIDSLDETYKNFITEVFDINVLKK